MRITIFGATGGTGKQLVEQAFAEGNEVRARAGQVRYLEQAEVLNDLASKLTDVVDCRLYY